MPVLAVGPRGRVGRVWTIGQLDDSVETSLNNAVVSSTRHGPDTRTTKSENENDNANLHRLAFCLTLFLVAREIQPPRHKDFQFRRDCASLFRKSRSSVNPAAAAISDSTTLVGKLDREVRAYHLSPALPTKILARMPDKKQFDLSTPRVNQT